MRSRTKILVRLTRPTYCAVMAISNMRIEQQGDVYTLQLLGEVDKPTVERVLEQLLQMKDLPEAILIVDISKMERMLPEARQVLSEMNATWSYRAVVICGGSFTMRSLMLLIARGLKLLGKFQPSVHVFKDTSDARQWISTLEPFKAKN